MKTTKVNWNIKKLARMAQNGSLNFNYPIQRAGGQWDALQKSLLIHSIAGDYPVPPVLLLSNDDVDYVLDGKQRISNIIDYIEGIKDEETGAYPPNAFKLHAETPSVTLADVEGEFELAGKYFDELHEDIQSEILGANMSLSRLEDATDEEIEELFYRWNNGTPLTKQQKGRAKMGVANATIIDALQKHSFLKETASFTPLQRRRSDDEAVVLQTMMLLGDTEIESFVADKILQYATDMRDNDITGVAETMEDVLDYVESTNIKSPLFKKLHLPTLLVVAKKAYDEDIDPIVFSAWVEDFSMAIDTRKRVNAKIETRYKDFTGAGSVKKDKVLGRMDAMLTHFDKFVKEFEIPVSEESSADDETDVENTPTMESEESASNEETNNPTDEKVEDEMKEISKELQDILG